MRALAIVMLAGCDKLLSLDDIPPVGKPGPVTVTGTFAESYITNDKTFAPQVGTYIPPSLAATAKLDDGTQAPVTYSADGTFSFALAHEGQRYRFAFVTPDGGGDLETDAPQLSVALSLAARPSVLRTQLASTTLLDFNLTGTFTATNYAWVTSTGQWSQYNTGRQSGTFEFDWRSAGAFAPPIGLLDASGNNDKLYVVEIESTPYVYIRQAFSIAIDLVDATTISIPGAFAQPMTQGCVTLSAALAEYAAAWMTVKTDLTPTYVYAGVATAPRPELGPIGDLLLAQYAQYPPLPKSAPQTLQYFDPYGPSPLIGYAGALLARDILLPGSTQPFIAYHGSRLSVPAPSTVACSDVAIDANAIGIVTEDVVGGVAIAADATSVALPETGALDVAWQVSGPADLATVQLYEIVNVSGYTVPHRLDSTATTASSYAFDASLLQHGHSYAIRILLTVGLPNAAGGDYVTRTYPSGSSDQWSHYFTVQ